MDIGFRAAAATQETENWMLPVLPVLKLGIEYIVEGLNEYFREGLRIIHEGG